MADETKPEVGRPTGRKRYRLQQVRGGLFSKKETVIVLQIEVYTGKYRPKYYPGGDNGYELVGVKTEWRDARPEDFMEIAGDACK
jgi:hypothetical protein